LDLWLQVRFGKVAELDAEATFPHTPIVLGLSSTGGGKAGTEFSLDTEIEKHKNAARGHQIF
jgi:hypothetical protein